MRFLLKILVLSIFAILTSCDTPEHMFSADELKVIDSLYKARKDSVDIEMERICDTIYSENYGKAVDSLKILREKEILDIISK